MKRFLTVNLAVAFFVISSVASAADGKVAPSASPPPQKGTLAGTASGGYGGIAMDGVWGSKDGSMDGEGTPVSASVSKAGTAEWVVKVFNNSEDQYRLSLELTQIGESGRVVKSDPFATILRGGQNLQRIFLMHPAAVNATVSVKSWKKVEKKTAAASVSPSSTPAELGKLVPRQPVAKRPANLRNN